MRHDPEVLQACGQYQLGLPRLPVAGRSGELLGRGTGSSLEFQEYREYLPGDDIRHLDWSAYARSDMLMVRMYREEISPHTAIYLDVSRSMNTGEGAKVRLARQLASLFYQLSDRMGSRPRLYLLNDDRPVVAQDAGILERLADLPFDAITPMDELCAEGLVPLAPQSVRIIVSDFLFPHDPERLIRHLGAAAGALWCIQVLSRWEEDPWEMGGRRLRDLERHWETDIVINRKTIEEYKQRLGRLRQSLTRECRRMHALFVPTVADHGLKTVCSENLCPAGILRV